MEIKSFIKKYKEGRKKKNFSIPYKSIPMHRKIILGIILIEIILFELLNLINLYKSNQSVNIYIIKTFRFGWLFTQFIFLTHFLKREEKIRKIVQKWFSIISIISIIECFFSFNLNKFIYYILFEIFLWFFILFCVEKTEENQNVMNNYKRGNLYKKLELLNNLEIEMTYERVTDLIQDIKKDRNSVFSEIRKPFEILFRPPISYILTAIFSSVIIPKIFERISLLASLTLFFILTGLILFVWNYLRLINILFFSQDYIISDLEEIANYCKNIKKN